MNSNSFVYICRLLRYCLSCHSQHPHSKMCKFCCWLWLGVCRQELYNESAYDVEVSVDTPLVMERDGGSSTGFKFGALGMEVGIKAERTEKAVYQAVDVKKACSVVKSKSSLVFKSRTKETLYITITDRTTGTKFWDNHPLYGNNKIKIKVHRDGELFAIVT